MTLDIYDTFHLCNILPIHRYSGHVLQLKTLTFMLYYIEVLLIVYLAQIIYHCEKKKKHITTTFMCPIT